MGREVRLVLCPHGSVTAEASFISSCNLLSDLIFLGIVADLAYDDLLVRVDHCCCY